MNRALAIISGIGAGVAAAYFLDPKKGADRRALVRDKFNAFKNDPSGTITEVTDGIREQARSYVRDAKAMIPESTSEPQVAKQPTQVTH